MVENGGIINLVDLKIQVSDRAYLLPEDSIILLLYVRDERPIRGRTVMQKELFLMYQEVLKKKYFSDLEIVNPEFVPYKYGPYSFKLSSALASLIFRGKVAKNGPKNREKFTITEDGKELARRIVELFPQRIIGELLEILKIRRKGWDQLGREGLMVRTVMLYPKFYEFSLIGARYSGGLQALKVIVGAKDETSIIVLDVLNHVAQEIEEYDNVKKAYYNKIDEKYRGETWGKLYVEST